MQGGDQGQQQAYDRGTTIFSPDGRLYQVEYAQEAVKQGSASLGVRTTDGVVLLVDAEKSSSLLERTSIEKLHKADAHIGIASAGHVADGRSLIDVARQQAQLNRVQYEQPVGVETLAKQIADHVQESTQIAGTRPFGVGLIIGGIENGHPRLYETDPGGTPKEWAALAIGEGRQEIQEFLADQYTDQLTLTEGIELAFRALTSVKDNPPRPEAVGIATVDTDSEQYRELSDDEIREHLERLELPDEESRDETNG